VSLPSFGSVSIRMFSLEKTAVVNKRLIHMDKKNFTLYLLS